MFSSKPTAKYCKRCAKGTVKPEREACKYCGGTEWVKAEASELRESMVKEAKMMSAMEGTDEQDDFWLQGTAEEALTALTELVDAAKADAEAQESKVWELRSVHLGAPGSAAEDKCVPDLLRAFLRWSQKPEDRIAGKWNISKAMRRATAFAAFSDKHHALFFTEPTLPTEPGIEECTKAYRWRVPKKLAPSGAVLWFVDLAVVDATALGELTDRQTMRWMWHLMLLSIFDSHVQDPGIIMVQGMGCAFSDLIHISRATKAVEHHMMEMFYGVVPMKFKEIHVVQCPWWMSALLRLMRLFLSSKMNERMHNSYLESMYASVGGQDFVPAGLLGGTGDYESRYAPMI